MYEKFLTSCITTAYETLVLGQKFIITGLARSTSVGTNENITGMAPGTSRSCEVCTKNKNFVKHGSARGAQFHYMYLYFSNDHTLKIIFYLYKYQLPELPIYSGISNECYPFMLYFTD